MPQCEPETSSPPSAVHIKTCTTARIASLDQCRGLCILLMIGGNFAGKFVFMPWILTHHRYGLSIAELFGPVFFLMVGFSYRLSYLRRSRVLGQGAANRSALRRYTLITLLGLIVYFGHFWDALTHIGMAGLLLVPVIGRPWPVRMAASFLFLAVYQGAYLYTGYDEWLMSHEYSLNGGPLAALSWGFLILWGTLLHDLWATRNPGRITAVVFLSALALCGAAWLLTLPWAGLKEPWPFTRYGMTAPYPLITCGIAMLIYLAFYWYCDRWGRRLPVIGPLGANPLLMYAIMGAFIGASKVLIRVYGEPGFYAALATYSGISLVCYVIARHLSDRNISIRIS